MKSDKPKEYVTGLARFCGRDFVVNSDVLIPRIETEETVPLVLARYPRTEDLSIADIGCGSGCLGITLAEKLPKSLVYLSDISPAALKVAQQNARGMNVKIVQSDLFADYPKNLVFDVVVANLPYVPSERIPQLQSSVRDFEPHLALDGGPDGGDVINRLVKQLPERLKPNGLAILEIDDTHTLKNFSIPKDFKGEIKKDQFRRNRFLIIN